MDLRSLSTQMVLSSVALVLLAVTAVGVPAILLIRQQMGRQAWSQVEQGSRASQTLYTANQSEVTDLAVLTAQRPTLRDLVTRGEVETLTSYLDTLRTGAGLDLMAVCTSGQQIAQAGRAIGMDVCRDGGADGFHIMPMGSFPRVWLLAAYPIAGGGVDPGEVIVGTALDDAFAERISDQTGLEHTLLVDGQPVATSFPTGLPGEAQADHRQFQSSPAIGTTRGTLNIEGLPYYFARISLDGTELVAEVALDVADNAVVQRRLVGILVGSIVTVATAGSIGTKFRTALAMSSSSRLRQTNHSANSFPLPVGSIRSWSKWQVAVRPPWPSGHPGRHRCPTDAPGRWRRRGGVGLSRRE